LESGTTLDSSLALAYYRNASYDKAAETLRGMARHQDRAEVNNLLG
jgi:hypothetical protein